MLANAIRGLPLEACGLFAGDPSDPDGRIQRFYPCENAAGSAKVYTVAPRDHLRADRDAEDTGWSITGVMHSHTHTDAYPSPTDVRQAVDPMWIYVIVSLRDDAPMLRAYRVRDEQIAECQVALEARR
jgi:proteasome lid subunit RPN8/RPN11